MGQVAAYPYHYKELNTLQGVSGQWAELVVEAIVQGHVERWAVYNDYPSWHKTITPRGQLTMGRVSDSNVFRSPQRSNINPKTIIQQQR